MKTNNRPGFGIPLLALGICFALGPLNPSPRPVITIPSLETAATTPEKLAPKKPKKKATIQETLFDKFLKYKTYKVEMVLYGQPTNLKGGFVHGPGHHTAALAALVLGPDEHPHFVLKRGDTRYTRVSRGEPYVLDGFVAGRMDKDGATSAKIALAELSEEVGGEVVGDTFRPLGELSPTMPHESTECDSYFMACVKIAKAPTGDGGKMEVPTLIGAKVVTPEVAFGAADRGEISDGSRAHTMYARALSAIGYLPELDSYVQDHPAFLEHYDTLGLGEVFDVRSQGLAGELPKIGKTKNDINDAVAVDIDELRLSDSAVMVDAKTRHAVKKNGLIEAKGEPFPNQFLKLDYDRAKVAAYFIHPERGPMVLMTKKARPVLKFAPGDLRAVRFDLADAEAPRGDKEVEPLEDARRLKADSGASSGQTDLYYQFWIKEMPTPEKPTGEGYVTLANAIEFCRTGHGDTQTECLLWRLAEELQWSPNLGMSWDEARELMSSGR